VSFQFLAPELARWDALVGEKAAAPPELMVVPFFADERPLRGAAGLVDWRMCGRLSRLLLSGRVGGGLGETTLLPARGLLFPRLLLVGLGPSEGFGEPAFREVAKTIAEVTRRLGVKRYALPLPGRTTARIAARRALELWLAENGDASEVWLVEPTSTQKDMSEVLGSRRR
jgi:hypothetical protein